MGSQVEKIYLRAAGGGDPDAQSTLAIAFLNHSDELNDSNPGFAAEFLASAELMAVLAYERRTPERAAHDTAILAAVVATRSIQCDDPVRSVEYRQWADVLFDAVEAAGDDHAKGIVAWALNRLADAGDELAAQRLNRVMEALPVAEAKLLRETVRAESKEPAQVTDGGKVQ